MIIIHFMTLNEQIHKHFCQVLAANVKLFQEKVKYYKRRAKISADINEIKMDNWENSETFLTGGHK